METQNFSIGEALSYGWKMTKENFPVLVGIVFIILLINLIPGLAVQSFMVEGGSVEQYIKQTIAQDSNVQLLQILLIGLGIALVLIIINTIISIGFLKVALKIFDGEKTGFSDLFSSYYGLLIKYILARVIIVALIFLLFIPTMLLFLFLPQIGLIGLLFGFIAFILGLILAVILSIKLFFVNYFIVDKRRGPVEAIKESLEITTGYVGHLFIFGFLIGLINALGGIPGAIIAALIEAVGLVANFPLLVGGFLGPMISSIGLFITIPLTTMATVFVYRKLLNQKTVISPISKGSEIKNY